MHVSELTTYNFRNLRDGALALPNGLICVVGKNGQGKTNIVEAISLLSFTRSFRTSDLKELIRWGAKELSVFAQITARNENRRIGISLQERERKAFIDGTQLDSVLALHGLVSCVCFSPTDLALVQGPPSTRRKFFDRHGCDLYPGLLRQYIEYQRALRSKNALLKSGNATRAAIEVWNGLLINSAVAIVNARHDLLSALEPRLEQLGLELFEKPGAITLRLRGPSQELITHRAGSVVTPEEVAQGFSKAIDREIEQQRTVFGPHRDEVVPFIFEREARSFASQGQSRSIVLALKLTLAEMIREAQGEPPILLLDDVDSELDQHRRAVIFEAVRKHGGQVFVTATENHLPESISSHLALTLSVDAGIIEKA